MTTNADNVALSEELADVVAETMQRLHVPGVAVGILHGDTELVAGYGVTNIEHPLPVSGSTLFQIGSTTKTMTALIAMRLLEEGRLDLDEPVRTYLPELRLQDPDATAGVTMRHLFTHTGGFEGDWFVDFGRGDDALEQAVAGMAGLTQIAPLGEVWSYCNSGFYLAGRVIEVIVGKPYETVAREMVLAPLGMTESYFFPEEVMTRCFAVGHNVQGDEVAIARPWALPRVANPAGGLTASVRDNLRYARFMMGDGTMEDGTRIVREDTLQAMLSPMVPAGPDRSVGIAWYSQTVDGIRLVSHGGGTNGQVSTFVFAPEQQFALSVVTNANKGQMLEAVTDWVYQRYLGITLPTPTPLNAPEEELLPYAGHYENIATMVDLAIDDGNLMLTVKARPEMSAAIRDEPLTPEPPMRLGLCGPDRLVVLEGDYKDMQLEALRNPDGTIRWLRLGSRLQTRKY